jgi:hypothetical protein
MLSACANWRSRGPRALEVSPYEENFVFQWLSVVFAAACQGSAYALLSKPEPNPDHKGEVVNNSSLTPSNIRRVS